MAERWVPSAGWVLTSDGRFLCPRHVAAGVEMARAELEGLPFGEAS